MDHVHERLERRFGSVDQTQAEEIEMSRAGNVALSVIFGGSQVYDAKVGIS
jgi:hypothetical protein